MIIDSETHVFYRLLPIQTNPEMSYSKRFTWHEFSGDLLAAEMDRAGVDKTILISYDADSIGDWLKQNGKSPEDYVGGLKYTTHYVRKYPEKFVWFHTLSDLRGGYLNYVNSWFDAGCRGIKLFPAHLGVPADGKELMAVYEVCARRGGCVILSFEDTDPPKTQTVADLLAQLPAVLDAFPEVSFQVMHCGNIAPDDPLAPGFFETVRSHHNVWVSTAPIEVNAPGDRNMEWRDGWEYPFVTYLHRMELLAEGIGNDRIQWATDWPWLDHLMLYPQAVDSIRRHATFWTEGDKAKFLGENTARFLGLMSRSGREVGNAST